MNLKNILQFLSDFIFKQLKSVTFGFTILSLIIITNYFNPTSFYRFDLLLLLVILIQILMVTLKLETKKELLAITVFHILGVVMEIIKVNFHQMWSYNETAYFMIMGVPIFSGFMYASVGSYIVQSKKHLKLTLINYPKQYLVVSLAILIYVNFLINKIFVDFRVLIILFSIVLFFKTYFTFELRSRIFKIHFLLSFLLISMFIWIAENIATYFGIWHYTSQKVEWHIVNPSIVSSWFMLAILSFIIANTISENND